MAAQNMEDAGKMATANVDGALKMWTGMSKSMQAVGAEMTDYAKRSFEDGTKTLEKLMSARSVEQAMEIQSTYMKRSYEEYVQQMTRIGSMYADLAKDGAKPFEATALFRR
jgi:hypothetical protein